MRNINNRSFLRYEAGDHVAVYPSNDSALVARVGELLNTDLDEVISLVNLDGKLTKNERVLALNRMNLIFL